MTRSRLCFSIKRWLSCLLSIALCLCLACCGSQRGSSSTTATLTTRAESSAENASEANIEPSKGADRDGDNDATGSHSRYDLDDGGTIDFGHPASAADRAVIAALIRRYYADAVAENGAKACSMIYSTYAEAIPEDYGTSPPGPAYAQGTTCPQVLTEVFKHFHADIAARYPKLKVASVRTLKRQGVAILTFGALREREIRVSREGKSWRVLALIDSPLP